MLLANLGFFRSLTGFFWQDFTKCLFCKKENQEKSPADEYLVYFYEPIKFIELSEN